MKLNTPLLSICLIASSSLYCMEDELSADSNPTQEITLNTKIQAGAAAAAPLLICPPLMVPLIAYASSDIAIRSSVSAVCTMPLNAAISTMCDRYIAPRSTANKVLKNLARAYIANRTRDYLTQQAIIPPAPEASTITEYVSHLAEDYTICSLAQYIAYAPYDRLMRNLSRNYQKKDGIIAQRKQDYDFDDLSTGKRELWNPNANPATKHIEFCSLVSSTLSNASFPKSSILCTICQNDDGILVYEAVGKKGSNLVSSRKTKYTTDTSEWYYMRPFGLKVFRKEIKKLHDTVLENHITIAGVPLKDIIQPPANASIDL